MSNNRVVIKLQLNTTRPVLTVNEYELSLECGIADLLKGLDQSVEYLIDELDDNDFLSDIRCAIYDEGFKAGHDELQIAIDENEDEYGPRIGTLGNDPEGIQSALSDRQCKNLCAFLLEKGYGPEKGS